MKTQLQQILYSTSRTALSTNLGLLYMYLWNVEQRLLTINWTETNGKTLYQLHTWHSFTEREYMHL